MEGKRRENGKTGNGSGRSSSSSSDLYHVKFTVVLSLMAWPLTYFINNGFQKIDQTIRALWMMVTGFLLLISIVGVVIKYSKVGGWKYYGFVLFAFTGMIDLIIALEYHGFISGFMSEYLKMGEPYLHSPWGSAISLFDGVGFYFMYLLLVYQVSNGRSWKSVGIYWAAGIINSMIVLVFGIFSGKHNPTFCVFLNAPYVIFPIVCFIRAFGKDEARQDWNQRASSGFLLKVFDLIIAFGLIGSMWVCMAKGLLAMGSEFKVFAKILIHEPFLLHTDPAPFLQIQSLVFFFYILPILCVSLYYISSSKKPQFLWDMTLVHAGVMLQTQFSFFFATLDPYIPSHMQSRWDDQYYWMYNLLLVIVPHLYLIRLLPHRISAKKQR